MTLRTLNGIGLLALVPTLALADFSGRVVHVQDGDTLTVLAGSRQVKVRLDSIDAPERHQAFYRRSTDSLKSICAGRSADVIETAKDRYGRVVGRVMCSGADANSEQVRRGMAWVFVRYAPKDSPLYALEAESRNSKRGLWSAPGAVPPWEWRAKKRVHPKAGHS